MFTCEQSTERFSIYNIDRFSYSVTNNPEARLPSGRASDFGARGRGFDPHSGRRFVSMSKIPLPPKNTSKTQEAVATSRHY